MNLIDGWVGPGKRWLMWLTWFCAILSIAILFMIVVSVAVGVTVTVGMTIGTFAIGMTVETFAIGQFRIDGITTE